MSMSSLKSESTNDTICLEFEIRLLEIAVLGKHTFGSYWNTYGHDYTISQHVLCYKIYEELEGGHFNYLVNRGRKLVGRSKAGHKNYHKRAMKISHEFARMHRFQNRASRDKKKEMLRIDSPPSPNVAQGTFQKDSDNATYQHISRYPNVDSFNEECYKSRISTSLEKCIMQNDLSLTLEEISSPGNLAWPNEPLSVNSSNSVEPIDCFSTKSTKSKIDDSTKRDEQDSKNQVQEELPSIIYSFTGDAYSSIAESFYEVFDKAWPHTPKSSSASVAFSSLHDGLYLHETDGQHPSGSTWNNSKELLDKVRCSFPDSPSSNSSRSVIQFNNHEEKDRELTPLECVEDELILFLNNSRKDPIMRASKEAQILDDVPSMRLGATIILDKFPVEDFKAPITWNIERTCYVAENIADLKSKYNILIQGAFKKSTRGYMWSNYYGFLLPRGFMLSFHKESYKEVIDFSKCTITSYDKQLKLKVNWLSDESKGTTWLMKFSCREHYKTWYWGIVQFTK